MKHVAVDILSPSTLVPRDELHHVTRALQTQVNEHLAPAWGITADLRLIGPRSRPRKDAWRLVLLDEHDPDCVDGYHELTRGGLPQGLVKLREAMACKTGWTSTASHELLEMLVNPDTLQAIFVWDEAVGGRVYGLEIPRSLPGRSFLLPARPRLDVRLRPAVVVEPWRRTARDCSTTRAS